MTVQEQRDALLEDYGRLARPWHPDLLRLRLDNLIASVRAEDADRLRALAPSWVAFAHGLAHHPDWHSEADWRTCSSYPCNEAARALLAGEEDR